MKNPFRRRWLVAAALALPVLAGVGPRAWAGAPDSPPPADPDGGQHQIMAYTIELGGAFLGVQPTDLTPELRRHFGVSADAGVLVAKVVDDSPAATAGIAVGDIVTAVDGQPIERSFDLRRAVGKREAGETVPVTLWRNGRQLEVSVTLTEREASVAPPDIHWEQLPHMRLGEVVDPQVFDLRLDPYSFHFEGIDQEQFEKLGEELRQMFDSDEWHDTVHRFETQRGDVDARIQDLEQLLHEL